MTGWALAWLSAGFVMADKTLAHEQQGISCACKRPPAASHRTAAGNFTGSSAAAPSEIELCCARENIGSWKKEHCRTRLFVAAKPFRKGYGRNTASTLSAKCHHPLPGWLSYLLKSHHSKIPSLCKLGWGSQVLDTAESLVMQRSFLSTSQQIGLWFFYFFFLLYSGFKQEFQLLARFVYNNSQILVCYGLLSP